MEVTVQVGIPRIMLMKALYVYTWLGIAHAKL